MEDFGNFDIVISCASGIERALKSELLRLSYGEVPIINGKATVKGNAFDLYRLNVNLRTAERTYIKVSEFTATTFDEMFDNVKEIPWEKIISRDGRIIVNGKSVKSKLFALSALQSVVKKAIVERFKSKGVNALREDGATYEVVFSLFEDNAEILLNASGTALHKRGYRDKVWIAPIKETLASAMILYSDYYYTRPFFDPFCGSGTISIETAMIGLNIAPNKNRDFACDFWKGFSVSEKKRAVEEALDKEQRDRKVEIFGFDIDGKAISLAKRHADRAGLLDKIKFSTASAQDFSPAFDFGTVITNPPYGERVIDKKSADLAIKGFGNKMKDYPNISCFIISSDKDLERVYGKRCDRKKKLFNSEKECNYYFYYAKGDKK